MKIIKTVTREAVRTVATALAVLGVSVGLLATIGKTKYKIFLQLSI